MGSGYQKQSSTELPFHQVLPYFNSIELSVARQSSPLKATSKAQGEKHLG